MAARRLAHVFPSRVLVPMKATRIIDDAPILGIERVAAGRSHASPRVAREILQRGLREPGAAEIVTVADEPC